MPYYAVNAGRGRSTHIMKSKNLSIPGVGKFLISNIVGFGGGTVKYTLCGLAATRYVSVFTPSEASCRECRKRWQLEVPTEARPAVGSRPTPGARCPACHESITRTPGGSVPFVHVATGKFQCR